MLKKIFIMLQRFSSRLKVELILEFDVQSS